MADSERVWLVERDYDDKGLVQMVYASPDGERYVRREFSANMLKMTAITAATEVESADLEPVADEDLQERYAAEASRMAADHDPDDAV